MIKNNKQPKLLNKNNLKTWNQQSSVCYTQLRTVKNNSLNDTNIDGLTEQFKLRTIKRFGEDVCLLDVSVNEFKTYDFIFHQITDEVIANLYVLGLWVLNRILGKIYGTSVVIEHTHHFLRNPIVMKKFLHSKKLSTTTPSNYILDFSYR